ncbi:MAG: phage tail protein [Croceitalea sp.]|nr:tail fiber protein [Croceitalea sp.]NNM17396.1 phage tail protein [Croceitalea sp.]
MNPFLGQIQPFGFNFAPRGWATCEGQLLPISQNTALFSLLGTTFGGDGRTTFGLPDLRGRSIVGVGNGPGLSDIRWGERSGLTQINLNATQLPSHFHSVGIPVNTAPGGESNNTGQFIAAHVGAFSEEATSGQTLAPFNSNNTGSSQSVNIRNPYLGMYIGIAMQGVYPSRS